MNLEELRSVQNGERRKSGLQSLRESFYAEAGEYVGELKRKRDRAADRADDPFSDPEVRELSDEIETAEEVIEAIYERRMGKLLKRASLAAAEMSVDEEGLTAEERELFHDIVEQIRQNKSNVLDIVAGDVDEGTDPQDREQTPTDTTTESSVSVVDAMGGGGESSADDATPSDTAGGDDRREVEPDPAPPGSGAARETGAEGQTPPGSSGIDSDDGTRRGDGPGPDDERITVKITRDVGEIFGVDDRQYDLATEDVVQLPEQNAEPLVERDAAERLE